MSSWYVKENQLYAHFFFGKEQNDRMDFGKRTSGIIHYVHIHTPKLAHTQVLIRKISQTYTDETTYSQQCERPSTELYFGSRW